MVLVLLELRLPTHPSMCPAAREFQRSGQKYALEGWQEYQHIR